MAGLLPYFLTGANAKVKVNGLTMAFCTDLNYTIVVNRAPAKVLGMYEPSSIEPLGYMVTGSFTVIRYMKDTPSVIKGAGGKAPNGVNERGNGVGAWFDGRITNEMQASESLDPSTFQFASGFDIEVYQKTAGRQMDAAKIRDCHITRASFTLNKRSIATQTFEFMALYADEDSFRADFSGQGQQFA